MRLAILAAAALAALVLAAPPVQAASLCATDGAASEALARATARGSAAFLEAASEAFLAFKAIEEASGAHEAHVARTRRLLDAAVAAYREALARSDDLAAADRFLKARDFERLGRIFGATPGTLAQQRWEAMTRIARDSATPAADLIRVCVAGAETLKSTIGTVRPETQRAQIRRAAYAWHLVLQHGAQVSDAFDASVR